MREVNTCTYLIAQYRYERGKELSGLTTKKLAATRRRLVEASASADTVRRDT
jgi:hypothetical protein